MVTANEEQSSDQCCNFCLAQGCKLMVCSKCRNARYCSKACQKAHWQKVHKLECCTPNNKRGNTSTTTLLNDKASNITSSAAIPILKALWNHVQQDSLSLDDDHYRIQKAQEEVIKLKSALKNKSQTKATRENKKMLLRQKQQLASQSQQNQQSEDILVSAVSSINPHTISNSWKCVVEDLTNINCYSILLLPLGKGASIPEIKNLHLSLTPHQSAASSSFGDRSALYTQVTLLLVNNSDNETSDHDDTILLLSVKLAGKITSEDEAAVRMIVHTDCISLRLMYHKHQHDHHEYQPSLQKTTTVHFLNELLTCKCCCAKLLVDGVGNIDDQIKKVLPLPSGCWDEIADYLICYEGDPAVTFTSSSYNTAIKGCVLEDRSVLVLHKDHLGSNVVVLAVEGYGERSEEPEKKTGSPLLSAAATDSTAPSMFKENEGVAAGVMYRGERSWRDLTGGGATLCCSQCCSILGYASISAENDEMGTSFRLYKHRLFGGRNTCGSFIAHEMVRYAESQAVFTFYVMIDSSDGHRATGIPTVTECLLLKLLSWDSRIAAVEEEIIGGSFEFQNAAKVVFQETFIPDSVDHQSLSPQIFWNNIDVCCPTIPDENTQKNSKQSEILMNSDRNTASVKIFLSVEEWKELLEELISKRFPASVANATAQIRYGKSISSGSTKEFSEGLSFLRLL